MEVISELPVIGLSAPLSHQLNRESFKLKTKKIRPFDAIKVSYEGCNFIFYLLTDGLKKEHRLAGTF